MRSITIEISINEGNEMNWNEKGYNCSWMNIEPIFLNKGSTGSKRQSSPLGLAIPFQAGEIE